MNSKIFIIVSFIGLICFNLEIKCNESNAMNNMIVFDVIPLLPQNLKLVTRRSVSKRFQKEH
jgi:nucleoside recognition membrane protein YjiH